MTLQLLSCKLHICTWRKAYDLSIAKIQRQHCKYIPKLATKNFCGSFTLALKNKLYAKRLTILGSYHFLAHGGGLVETGGIE